MVKTPPFKQTLRFFFVEKGPAADATDAPKL
jgi:hypothetical protein